MSGGKKVKQILDYNYLRHFSESRSSSGSTPSLRPSVRPLVCPQHFRDAKFVCTSYFVQ